MNSYKLKQYADGPWPMYYLEYDEEVFIRHMKCEKGIVYWWFTMLASKPDAAHYKIKVSIYMKHNEVLDNNKIYSLFTKVTDINKHNKGRYADYG
jgi:hypothetical protein